MECIIFLENTKFHECVRSAWILVCKWSPGSAFGVRTFQQKKMWECVGVRRSALKDSRVRLECALLTHCYALQTHFSTARVQRQTFESARSPIGSSFTPVVDPRLSFSILPWDFTGILCRSSAELLANSMRAVSCMFHVYIRPFWRKMPLVSMYWD